MDKWNQPHVGQMRERGSDAATLKVTSRTIPNLFIPECCLATPPSHGDARVNSHCKGLGIIEPLRLLRSLGFLSFPSCRHGRESREVASVWWRAANADSGLVPARAYSLVLSPWGAPRVVRATGRVILWAKIRFHFSLALSHRLRLRWLGRYWTVTPSLCAPWPRGISRSPKVPCRHIEKASIACRRRSTNLRER